MRLLDRLRRGPRLAPVVLAGVALAVAGPAGADETRLPTEVQTFWQAPAEQEALAVIRDAFTRRGGRWVTFPTRDAADNRRMAFRRIIEGIPPFALQWHAGRELRVMSDSGVIRDLSAIADGMDWLRVLHSGVIGHLGHDGAFYGLPIGVHGNNWAWFNARLRRRYADAVPGDWAALEAMLARSRADRGPGIAMGVDPWQRMLLLTQILIGEGGAAVYRDLQEHGDPDTIDRPAFRDAFAIFARLRRYDAHDPAVGSWLDAAKAVVRGDAVVQFMGDWVRPELAVLGALPDRDFECRLAIGREKRHLSVIDVFVFPRRDDQYRDTDVRLMAETVLAPETQLAFSRLKGAIPVRSDLAGRIDDACLRAGYDLFATPGAPIPAAAMIARERPLASLSSAVSAFWDDPGVGVDAGIARLKAALAAP